MEPKLGIFIILVASLVIFILGTIIWKAAGMILEALGGLVSLMTKIIDNDTEFKETTMSTLIEHGDAIKYIAGLNDNKPDANKIK